MPTIDIKGTLVDFPDSLSPDQLRDAAERAANQLIEPAKKESSLVGKAWEALTIPEQKSREGLQMLADLAAPKTEVTGNMKRDIVANIPKIGLESLAATAPSFISRGALATGGTLKALKLAGPALKAIGNAGAKAGESISGMEYRNPGILKKIANDPTMLFAKGKEAASPMYEAAKTIGGDMGNLSDIPEKKTMVKQAYKLARQNQLNPTQALEARKELSKLKDSVTDGFFRKATEKFNELAKPVFGEADTIHAKGVQASEARRLFPVNKSGKTSIAKSVLGTIGGIVPSVAMSPLAQSTAAATLGTVAKAIAPFANNAIKAGSLSSAVVKTLTEAKARELLKEAKNNKAKARERAKELGYEIPE